MTSAPKRFRDLGWETYAWLIYSLPFFFTSLLATSIPAWKKDVLLLEQNQLAGGTTWHAAGLIGRLRTTNSMTKINKYSAELYASLEKETGHSVGWKQVGSLIVGRSAERMQQLQRTAAMSEWFGVEVQIISPKAALEKWPLLRIDDVLGAADHKREGAVERESHAGDVASGLEEHAL